MTRDQLLEKSLGDLREIAKLQGVKSITKYRKGELVDIIMNGGSKLSAVKPKAEAEEKAGAVSAPSAPQRTEEAPAAKAEPVPQAQAAAPQQAQPAPAPSAPQGGIPRVSLYSGEVAAMSVKLLALAMRIMATTSSKATDLSQCSETVGFSCPASRDLRAFSTPSREPTFSVST